jgi:hypothetical protein
MAQSGYTPISLYYSATSGVAPTSGNLVNGELAINITDGKLYFKNTSGAVTLLASAAGAVAATNLFGGTSGQIPYQNGPSSTTFMVAPTTASTYLGWNGSGFYWSSSTGASGYSGFSGYSGGTGTNGTSGYSGISGYSGYSGFSGSGVSGYSGSGISGYSGISGFSGFSGISGYSGSGISGFSGFSGISGFSGNNGATGSTGNSGFSGFSGFSGYSGSNGVSGTTGASGFSGATGASGYSGISGYSGQGLSGFSGFSGYSGATAASGYSGTSGFSGISGYSGSGVSGFSGFSGYSGLPASSTAFAATFNDGGAGAASPTNFNGSVARTISYNTIGAPGISGTNATGTWPIGISGTAATATNQSGGSVNATSIAYSTTLTGGTGIVNLGSGQFYKDASGNVSIGSTSTPATLYVKGGNSNNLSIDNGGQQFTTLSLYNNGTEKAQMYWDQTNTLFVLGTDVGAPVVFKAATVERMRISSAGGVSIGTTTDAGVGNLLVNGTVTANSYGAVSATSVTSSGDISGAAITATNGVTASTLPFFINGLTISSNYTLSANLGAHSVGPITVNTGVVVTISSGSRWVVL